MGAHYTWQNAEYFYLYLLKFIYFCSFSNFLKFKLELTFDIHFRCTERWSDFSVTDTAIPPMSPGWGLF